MFKNPLVCAVLAGIAVYAWLWYTEYEDERNKFAIPVAVAVIAYFACKWYCNKNSLETQAYTESPIEISIVPMKT